MEENLTHTEVLDTLSTQLAGWNSRDLEKFMQGYSRSKDVVYLANGEGITGYEMIREYYLKRFQSSEELGQLSLGELRTVPFGSDYAFASAGFTLMAGLVVTHGFFSLVLLRETGKFRIVVDHTVVLGH